MSGVTPPQTAGPFFADALLRDDTRVLAGADVPGTRIRVVGKVRDGTGAPVPDAMVEVWQADDAGRYRHPADDADLGGGDRFLGWGRAGTDDVGEFWFETVKPGRVASRDTAQPAPHLVLQVFARGLLDHLTTRMYFADEANDADPVLASVPVARRQTMVAQVTGPGTYRFDIVLRGDAETVFFDVGGRRRAR